VLVVVLSTFENGFCLSEIKRLSGLGETTSYQSSLNNIEIIFDMVFEIFNLNSIAMKKLFII